MVKGTLAFLIAAIAITGLIAGSWYVFAPATTAPASEAALVAAVATATASPTAAATSTVPPTPSATIAPSQTAEPTIAPTIEPTQTSTVAPTIEPTPKPTVAPTAEPTIVPTSVSTVAPTAKPTAASDGPVEVNGRVYDAYVPAAGKQGQDYKYSCQFDGVWVILQTYGIDVSVDELISRVPKDTSIEPYYEETPNGFVIYGGDINNTFSGDLSKNFMARSNGSVMIPLFASYGLEATPVRDRASLEAALRRGELVWTKATADFKPWRPATWIMPDGSTQITPLGNEHTVVVIGYNSEGVVVRDTLGPTASNPNRTYEYDVPWETFMRVWGEYQHYDALAVARPN